MILSDLFLADGSGFNFFVTHAFPNVIYPDKFRGEGMGKNFLRLYILTEFNLEESCD